MSEYVFAYLLAHERRIFDKRASQAEGRWDATPPGTLRGRQLGLLGVGTIGSALASTAKHFGMTVRGYTRASEESRDVDRYSIWNEPSLYLAPLFACDRPRRPKRCRPEAPHAYRRLLLRAAPREDVLDPGAAAKVADLAGGDAVQPARDVVAVERLEPPAHHQEDLLHDVVTVGIQRTSSLASPAGALTRRISSARWKASSASAAQIE